MLAQLGDLLRLSFETVDVQEVSLAQELDFLRKYVAIEQARFRERLHVTFDIEPGLARLDSANVLHSSSFGAAGQQC
jgi:sensor histidine kinase YesM